MPTALLGIDLGTSSVKALLLRPDGALLGRGQSAYQLQSPRAGWAETPTEDWWSAVVDAVGQAMTGGRVDVVGACCTGQMHGVVLVGEGGDSLGPGICWPDSRAWEFLGLYRNLPEDVRRRLANPLAPGMEGPILAWLSNEAPRRLERTRWALSPKDWLRLRLTGEAATDPSDASGTLLWDIAGDGWDDEVLEALGLSRELFPPVVASSALAGVLGESAANELGLNPGVPVAVGCADTAAAILGAGVDVSGGLMLNMGSGAQLVSLSKEPVLDASPRLNCFRQAFPGWYRMAGVQNAGVATQWALRVLGATWEEAYSALESVPPGSDGLAFVPLLTSERALIKASGTLPNRGAWVGMGLHHQRQHLLRATLEGGAFLLRQGLDLLDVPDQKVCLVGGGASSAAERQLLADVLDRDLYQADVPDASARGAAGIAGLVAGLFKPADMEVLVPVRRAPVSPGSAAELYSEAFGSWLDQAGALGGEGQPCSEAPDQT